MIGKNIFKTKLNSANHKKYLDIFSLKHYNILVDNEREVHRYENQIILRGLGNH